MEIFAVNAGVGQEMPIRTMSGSWLLAESENYGRKKKPLTSKGPSIPPPSTLLPPPTFEHSLSFPRVEALLFSLRLL